MGKTIVHTDHQVCEQRVEVPTIVIEPPSEQNPDPMVCIQWFGLLDDEEWQLPDQTQLLFPVDCSHDDMIWCDHPEQHEIAFLGQVKDWPNPAVLDQMIELHKSPKCWIAWLVNHHVTMRYGEDPNIPGSGHDGPSSFTVPIIQLADPRCGVINPKLYSDTAVATPRN